MMVELCFNSFEKLVDVRAKFADSLVEVTSTFHPRVSAKRESRESVAFQRWFGSRGISRDSVGPSSRGGISDTRLLAPLVMGSTPMHSVRSRPSTCAVVRKA